MPEEIQDDNIEPETSQVQDEEAESSTEETQVEEATSQEATEKPFNEHPRFQELISEKNELKDQNKALQQQMFQLINKAPQENKEAIQEKLYDANTPEEKAFWAQVEKIADAKASKARSDAEKVYQHELAKRDQMIGGVIAKDFLKAHPEVKKSSEEMKEITQKAQIYAASGMSLETALEDAYTVVMSPKLAQMAVEKEKQRGVKRKQDKLAANVETKSVQTLPDNKVVSIEDAFDAAVKEGGFEF